MGKVSKKNHLANLRRGAVGFGSENTCVIAPVFFLRQREREGGAIFFSFIHSSFSNSGGLSAQTLTLLPEKTALASRARRSHNRLFAFRLLFSRIPCVFLLTLDTTATSVEREVPAFENHRNQ